jgi:alkanesulfonate monooxygenase SsuD/methylene tetrahydromethanopterin reductase-like flavin-dependent oxidoreductase (luciferase family)
MLDHLSRGRFQLGVGRGGALIEHQRYGIDPATAQAMYHEAFAVLMQACETDVLNFDGRFYHFKDYLTVAKPVQRPHPPLWYGAPSADAVPWAVSRSVNVISLGPASRARDIVSRYRLDWAEAGRMIGDLPMIGISRHIVVAETDAEARRIADDAYRPWREALEFLFKRSNFTFPLTENYPPSFEALAAIGHGIAGSPETVLEYLKGLTRETGVNYIACHMIFGTMRFEAAATSVRLFAREVIPVLQQHHQGA